MLFLWPIGVRNAQDAATATAMIPARVHAFRVRRMTADSSNTIANAVSGFVELGMAPGGSTGECSVEAEDGKGKKLKMHLKGDGCAKAVEIAKAFWKRRR